MRRFLRIDTLYFFQIVKEPNSPRLKSPEASKLKSARFQTLRIGGGERDRTDDLLLAKQALSQLSYTPVPRARSKRQDFLLLSSCFLLLDW